MRVRAAVCRVYIYGSGKVRRERLPDCESQRPRATSGCRDRHSTIVVDCQIPTDKREIPFSQIPSRFTPHAFVYSIIDHRQPDPRYLCYLAPRPPYRRRAPRVLPICTINARILHAPRTACGCAGARLINVAFDVFSFRHTLYARCKALAVSVIARSNLTSAMHTSNVTYGKAVAYHE